MSWDSPVSPKDAKNSIVVCGEFYLGYPRVLGGSVLVLNFNWTGRQKGKPKGVDETHLLASDMIEIASLRVQ